jgi:hypothetical protein
MHALSVWALSVPTHNVQHPTAQYQHTITQTLNAQRSTQTLNAQRSTQTLNAQRSTQTLNT